MTLKAEVRAENSHTLFLFFPIFILCKSQIKSFTKSNNVLKNVHTFDYLLKYSILIFKS